MDVVCPMCKSDNVIQRGYLKREPSKEKYAVRFHCEEDHEAYVDEKGNDHSWFSVPLDVVESEKKDFRIGIADIEMLPAIAYTWGIYDQNISMGNVIQDTCLLSWAGKYLDSDEIFSDIMTPKEAKERNPERIVKSVFEFVNSCDIVVGHNWSNFDGKILNGYFLRYAKPVKYLTVDTLLTSRSVFRFTSNKLKDINNTLGIRNKVENEGMPLWIDCSNGKKESLDLMLDYNIGDIFATQELYLKIRGFIPNHLNIARYNNYTGRQCGTCLGTDFKKEGTFPAGKGMYELVRCTSCGSLKRYGTNLLSKSKRESLLSQ